MHIVHVVRQFAPGIGGIENYVLNLARAQVKSGHRVTVVTLDRIFSRPEVRLRTRERLAGCEVVRVPYFGSYKYPVAPTVLRHISGCDLVHVHAVDFFFDFLAWTRWLHRRPLVASTHGGFFHTGFARGLKQIFFQTVTRASIRGYRAILASSVQDLVTFGQIRRTGIAAVENGVDTAKFHDTGSTTFRKHLIYLGRFASNKRIDRLFDFVRELGARDPGWRLSVIGSPWDQSEAELRAMAAERGVADQVRVLAGLSDEEISDVISDASIAVSASEYEGFGISVIETMSAGLWPLLNGIPPFRRIHAESGLGLVGDFADPCGLSDRFLAELPRLEAAYPELRAAAIDFAARYDWSGVAARIASIYDDVIGEAERLIVDVPVAVTTTPGAIDALDRRVGAGKPTAVAFLNAHAANIARKDGAFRSALGRFVVFNDGVGLDLASRILFGRPFPENLNGTDFTPAFLRRTRHRFRIFLLGAQPDVVAAAARRLAREFPQHQIVGYRHGYFGDAQSEFVADRIRATGADLLLVGMGNPRQELWLDRHLEATGVRLAFAVGALFDFLSGSVPRAPEWVRALRLEWTFRLALEPQRLWRRYVIGNAAFLARVLQQKGERRYFRPEAAGDGLSSQDAALGLPARGGP